ncbi:MAG: hypothetical protein Q4D98_03150 [Planctomycetia bacterium]|nr:hypothetical protein [Planctomycetia bacterium]
MMETTLCYGENKVLTLHADDAQLLYVHDDGAGDRTRDQIADAVKSGLEKPLEYPPLAESLLEGDHVVIPLAPQVPEGETVLRAVLDYLFSQDAMRVPGRVTILRSPEDAVWNHPRLTEILPSPELAEKVEVVTHNPKDKDSFALLGLDAASESLVLNRLLFDADVILPVGSFLPSMTTGYYGIHTPLYPLFSDEVTQRRFHFFSRDMHERQHDLLHQLSDEVQEVTRQLGVALSLQVIPGLPGAAGTGVADVVFGNYHDVFQEGYSRYRDRWTFLSGQTPNMVVGSITGAPMQQCWRNVSRALVTASRIVSEGGVIALCCDVAGELPMGLEVYRRTQDVEKAAKWIRREDADDAQMVLDMLPVLQDYRVFFLSPLDGDLLEELNIMPLADPQTLERLLRNSGTCMILPDVHRLIV